MKVQTCFIGAGLLVLLAGCPVTEPVEAPVNSEMPKSPERPAAQRVTPAQHPVAAPARVEAVPEPVMTGIRADLIARTQARSEQISVIRAEKVIWRDGALGCAEPGQLYTEALVDGYWIVLGHAGKHWDYRARRNGIFRLCTTGKGEPPLPRDPDE